jgi:hypothetical protein
MKKYIMITAAAVLGFTAGVAHASVAVPEIDPGTAASAIALLGCGVLILARKLRRK